MRIVLTGATGFAGGATLARLLDAEQVDAVTALSRKPLTVAHPKLTVHLQQDFGSWDAGLLADLAEHDACVWALGAKASDVDDPGRYRRVTHDFTLGLAVGLAESNRGHLRFSYLSGMGADPARGPAPAMGAADPDREGPDRVRPPRPGRPQPRLPRHVLPARRHPARHRRDRAPLRHPADRGRRPRARRRPDGRGDRRRPRAA